MTEYQGDETVEYLKDRIRYLISFHNNQISLINNKNEALNRNSEIFKLLHTKEDKLKEKIEVLQDRIFHLLKMQNSAEMEIKSLSLQLYEAHKKIEEMSGIYVEQ